MPQLALTSWAKLLDETTSEADLLRIVVDFARRRGWLVHHDRPAIQRHGRWLTPIMGDPGFPDLVLVREGHPGTVMHVECKSGKGQLSPDQRIWREALECSGATYYLWRPHDWPAILETLQ